MTELTETAATWAGLGGWLHLHKHWCWDKFSFGLFILGSSWPAVTSTSWAEILSHWSKIWNNIDANSLLMNTKQVAALAQLHSHTCTRLLLFLNIWKTLKLSRCKKYFGGQSDESTAVSVMKLDQSSSCSRGEKFQNKLAQHRKWNLKQKETF